MTKLRRIDVFTQTMPMILAMAVAPLAGVIDTAVMGAVGQTEDIGGVALSAVLFNLLYTTFYFLRMGSSGLAAQAHGAGDRIALHTTLLRALLVAVIGGCAVLLLSPLYLPLGLNLLDGSEQVKATAAVYFNARIFGAVGTLLSYAVMGWLIGQANSKAVLVMAAVTTLTNAVLDVVLVMGFDQGVFGLGIATAVAETTGAAMGIFLALRLVAQTGGWSAEALQPSRLLNGRELAGLASLSTDMMVRSWALLIGFAVFINSSASHGDDVLAGTHVLLQVITVWAFVLDGFAFTAETTAGKAIGANSRPAFVRAVRLTTEQALLSGLLASALTMLCGPAVLQMWIQDPPTLAVALRYLPWCAVVPLVGVPAWQLDGIFIGATRSAEMRNAAIAALLFYVAVDFWLQHQLAADGMWTAFVLYYAARAVTLGLAYPRILNGFGTA